MIRTPNTGITPWGLGSGDGIHLKRVKNWEWGGVDRPLPSNGMGRTKGPARCGCIRMTWNPTGHPHHQNPGSNSSYTLVLHLQNGINRNKPQPDNGCRGQANAQPPSAVLPPPPHPHPSVLGQRHFMHVTNVMRLSQPMPATRGTGGGTGCSDARRSE